jgi:hypothetical protein
MHGGSDRWDAETRVAMQSRLEATGPAGSAFSNDCYRGWDHEAMTRSAKNSWFIRGVAWIIQAVTQWILGILTGAFHFAIQLCGFECGGFQITYF